MAALAQEVARSTLPELKAAFERGFEEIVAARGGDQKETIFQSAAVYASADLRCHALRSALAAQGSPVAGRAAVGGILVGLPRGYAEVPRAVVRRAIEVIATIVCAAVNSRALTMLARGSAPQTNDRSRQNEIVRSSCHQTTAPFAFRSLGCRSSAFLNRRDVVYRADPQWPLYVASGRPFRANTGRSPGARRTRQVDPFPSFPRSVRYGRRTPSSGRKHGKCQGRQ